MDNQAPTAERKPERIPHVYVPVSANPTRQLREFCEYLTRAENNGLTCVTLDLREREAIFVTTQQHLAELANRMQEDISKQSPPPVAPVAEAQKQESSAGPVRETIVYNTEKK